MGYYTSRLMMGLSTGDADAAAFLTAAGITDATITSAINKLVTDLKTFGLWDKMKAIYPFVEGTAATHKWNLKDPRDLDVAGRLAFGTGMVHNANGITGNGSSAYADTHFNPKTKLIDKSNFGISGYSRTNSIEFSPFMGVVDNHTYVWIALRTTTTNDTAGIYDESYNYGNWLTNSLGLFTVVRSDTTQTFYQNDTQKSQRVGFGPTSDIDSSIYLLCRNLFGSPSNYSTRNMAFAAIHESFSPTEVGNYYSTVQAFQTTLGRQV